MKLWSSNFKLQLSFQSKVHHLQKGRAQECDVDRRYYMFWTSDLLLIPIALSFFHTDCFCLFVRSFIFLIVPIPQKSSFKISSPKSCHFRTRFRAETRFLRRSVSSDPLAGLRIRRSDLSERMHAGKSFLRIGLDNQTQDRRRLRSAGLQTPRETERGHQKTEGKRASRR